MLVVGAGPAGLEAALAAGQRGYDVILAEAREELGGRVTLESRMPGLAAWARVRDYRGYQLSQLPNVEIYRESPVTAAEVLEFGAPHVAIATGAEWRGDGFGRNHQMPIPGTDGANLFTPDDIMHGNFPSGAVLIYDDDHGYLGSVIAEQLVEKGCRVTLATPAGVVAIWTEQTLEQHRIQARLLDLGVTLITSNELKSIDTDRATLACHYTGREQVVETSSVVLVTSRLPRDELYQALAAAPDRLESAGIATLKTIGDCHGPATIAAAVYEGHRFARELGEATAEIPFRREVTALSSEFDLP